MSHISLGAKHARTYPKEKQAWTDLREGEGEEMGERESSGERESVEIRHKVYTMFFNVYTIQSRQTDFGY